MCAKPDAASVNVPTRESVRTEARPLPARLVRSCGDDEGVQSNKKVWGLKCEPVVRAVRKIAVQH